MRDKVPSPFDSDRARVLNGSAARMRVIGMLTAAALLSICSAGCSGRPKDTLLVRFSCEFANPARQIRIGLDLASGRAMLGPPDSDAMVQVHLVAKDNELALLPGGDESATPQVRIHHDGTAIMKTKTYPSEQATDQHGSCRRV